MESKGNCGTIDQSDNAEVYEGGEGKRSTSAQTEVKEDEWKCEDITAGGILIFKRINEVQDYRKKLRRYGSKVGFVPTMGALHAGHMSLIELAAYENEAVIVSIYVNPGQFGVGEDYTSYPRTWNLDCEKLDEVNRRMDSIAEAGKITAIFAPNTRVMYPEKSESKEVGEEGSFVNITPISSLLEGVSRPTFFRGVTTICMKLFNVIMPHRVYFGQKDIQQTVIIRKMIRDFFMPIEMRTGKTVRETDGLALSSRNMYLGEKRRKIGLVLFKALSAGYEAYVSGLKGRNEILKAVEGEFERAKLQGNESDFTVDYISLAGLENLVEVDRVEDNVKMVLSSAIILGESDEIQPVEGEMGKGSRCEKVRLLDNVILG